MNPNNVLQIKEERQTPKNNILNNTSSTSSSSDKLLQQQQSILKPQHFLKRGREQSGPFQNTKMRHYLNCLKII